MNSTRPKWIRGAALAVFVLALLGGCRENEQDRVFLYKKGTYLGKADQHLSEETLSEIRNRGRRQGFDL